MKIKTKSEIREKKKRIKEKLSIRQVWKTTPKDKKGATWEFELFKKIARERCSVMWIAFVKHIFPNGELGMKPIIMDNLTPINFSHIKPKGMYPELRLYPNNIEIVSRAYHEWQHTKQIPQTNYIN